MSTSSSKSKASGSSGSGGRGQGRRSRRKRRVELALNALWGISFLAVVGGLALWFLVFRPKMMEGKPTELKLSNVRAAHSLAELDQFAAAAQEAADVAHDYDLASDVLESVSESRFRIGRTAGDQNRARAEKFQARTWKLDSVTLEEGARGTLCEETCKEYESLDSDTPAEIRKAALLTYLHCLDWMFRQVDTSGLALERLIAAIPRIGSDFSQDDRVLEKLRDVLDQIPVNALDYDLVQPLSSSLMEHFQSNSDPQVQDWIIGFRDRLRFRKMEFLDSLEKALRGSEVAMEDVMASIEPVLEGFPSRLGMRRACAVLWTLEGAGKIDEAKNLVARIQASLKNNPTSLSVGEFSELTEIAQKRFQARGQPLQFELKNARGRLLTPKDFAGKELVIVFVGANHPNRNLNSQNDIFRNLQKLNVALVVIGQGMTFEEINNRYGTALREELVIPDSLSNCELGKELGVPTDPFCLVINRNGQLVETAVPLPNLQSSIDKARE